MAENQREERRGRWQDQGYRLLALAAIVLIGTGTVAYYFLEGWSWVDSLYFSVVAVTTVGFGDLHPSSDASKIFTVGYLLVGISIVAAYLNLRMQLKADARLKSAD